MNLYIFQIICFYLYSFHNNWNNFLILSHCKIAAFTSLLIF